MKKLTIAIDGPAGAGKSSVAKLLANKVGYLYIDTGAMYRAFTWAVLEKGVDISDENAVKALVDSVNILSCNRLYRRRLWLCKVAGARGDGTQTVAHPLYDSRSLAA